MNKKFYLALVATAALFASCSSDQIAEAPNLDVDDSQPVKIGFAIGNVTAGVTRTTGSGAVGVSADGTNLGEKWKGQSFNVFMLEKGTVTLAQDENGAAIYDNKKLTTTESTPGNGLYDVAYEYDVDGTTILYTYYPGGALANKVYDFWAYRTDGAEKLPYAVDATEKTITVPFEIDGSQDVMYATTAPSATSLSADKIYTAYSARRGVQPTFSFKHGLTRLTFKAIANDAKMVNEENVKITGIEVRSKKTGALLVGKVDATGNEDRITWTDAAEKWDDATTLTPMILKQRSQGVNTPEDGTWVEVTRAQATANGGAGTNIVPPGGKTPAFTLTTATKLYAADQCTQAANGKPNGTQTTFADVTGDVLYYWNITQDLVLSGSTDVTAQLDNLEPVALTVSGATAGTPAHTDWVASDATEYGAAGANAIDTYASVDYDAATHDALLLVEANDGKIYNFNGTYKKVAYTAAVPATAGTPDMSDFIGESLFLAPADANGYEVTVHYQLDKKANSANPATPTDFSSTVVIKRTGTDPNSGAQGYIPYEAGSTYLIKIKLYSDHEVAPTTTVEDLTPGNGTDNPDDPTDGAWDF